MSHFVEWVDLAQGWNALQNKAILLKHYNSTN